MVRCKNNLSDQNIENGIIEFTMEWNIFKLDIDLIMNYLRCTSLGDRCSRRLCKLIVSGKIYVTTRILTEILLAAAASMFKRY